MGHAVQGDIAVGGAANGWTACMYHLYTFFNTWLPANYSGRITIVDSDPGSGGTWVDETTVTDDAFIVVEMVDEWSDTTQWQAVFAVRDANSAGTLGSTVGAVAIPSDGLWCGLAPQGGWDDVTRTFGSEAFTGLRFVRGRSLDAAGSALIVDPLMNFGYMDRVDSAGLIDNGALFVHIRIGGIYAGSFIVGAFSPFNDSRSLPCMLVAGMPVPFGAADTYGGSGAAGTVPNKTVPGTFELAQCDAAVTLDGLLIDEYGEYSGYPLLWTNKTQLNSLGWFDGLTRIDTATALGSTFDSGLKWACTALAWPWGVDVPTV